jgi:hypothetical protein
MRLLILFFFFSSFASFSQDEFMLWTSAGVEGKIIKKMSWSAELNGRFGDKTLETFFPQLGVEYKVKKWFRPSIEYRFIVDKNKYGNYKSSNRINFNANFKKSVDRFGLDARIRYQYGFTRLVATEEYDSDFDQAIRLKPAVSYDINNSIFTPKISAEFFYNPIYGPISPGFNKIRIAVGFGLELDGPHSISMKYQLDKKFNNYSAPLRHVIGFEYGYKL